jgi:hypothetical protein
MYLAPPSPNLSYIGTVRYPFTGPRFVVVGFKKTYKNILIVFKRQTQQYALLQFKEGLLFRRLNVSTKLLRGPTRVYKR